MVLVHFSHSHRDSLQSSAFSPTFFVGEKVAEGRMRGHLTVAALLHKQQARPRMNCRANQCSSEERGYRILQRPPHPPSAPSPPEKARGEKTLDAKESLKGLSKAAAFGVRA
jgi:hypothetical protein